MKIPLARGGNVDYDEGFRCRGRYALCDRRASRRVCEASN